jgi:HAE1 family hydrophobic/amphiphilic exporter-1
MASSVATPIEKKLSAIAGVAALSSTSVLGETEITVQFDLDRAVDGAALDVQSALSQAQRILPPDMINPPSFRKVNPSEAPVISLSVNSATLSLFDVDEFAETRIAQRISMLPGVGQVIVLGGQNTRSASRSIPMPWRHTTSTCRRCKTPSSVQPPRSRSVG